MRLVVDKTVPPGRIYIMNKRHIHYGVSRWRRLWAKLRREWWA